MAFFCDKCGNKLEGNADFCSKCGNKLTENNLNNQVNKKKFGYGKALGFTILGALGIYILLWVITLIFRIIGIELGIFSVMFSLPILMIVFSPIIALVIYNIKK